MFRELPSLRVKSDPLSQPASGDPIERATWSSLHIEVRGRAVTRILDRALGTERTMLHVPTFSIVEWIIRNWWALFEEPARTEQFSALPVTEARYSWTRRHCLRSADSALLLPALYLFSDGLNLRLYWTADEAGSLPNMPGEFVDSGSASLPRAPCAAALEEFVSDTLLRVSDIDDERADQVRQQWNVIQSSEPEVMNFCRLAGRLGLDPYEAGAISTELVDVLEQDLSDPDNPLVRDLTEVADPDLLAQQWMWVHGAAAELKSGQEVGRISQHSIGITHKPWDAGYQFAQKVRHAASLTAHDPLSSVPAIAQTVLNATLATSDQYHVPGTSIDSVVGWRGNGDFSSVGPLPHLEANQRFVQARALFHALTGCDNSVRLLTRAHTWDQQASRAFAAELLAPRHALAERTGETADQETIDALANEYRASTRVVQRQLQNCGVSLVD